MYRVTGTIFKKYRYCAPLIKQTSFRRWRWFFSNVDKAQSKKYTLVFDDLQIKTNSIATNYS